uniref:Uncharacterized protein n=1 Tax=Alexandrium monilatum TaxID=311494 RepID=A0A7S4SSR0_9DINO
MELCVLPAVCLQDPLRRQTHGPLAMQCSEELSKRVLYDLHHVDANSPYPVKCVVIKQLAFEDNSLAVVTTSGVLGDPMDVPAVFKDAKARTRPKPRPKDFMSVFGDSPHQLKQHRPALTIQQAAQEEPTRAADTQPEVLQCLVSQMKPVMMSSWPSKLSWATAREESTMRYSGI